MPKQTNHFKHDCDLNEEEVQTHVKSPFVTCYQRFLHHCRIKTTVRKQVDSQLYFRSLASLLKERKRHLNTPRYKYVIHPFSFFAQKKASVICILWFVMFLVEAYMGSFLAKQFFSSNSFFSHHLLFVGNCIFLFDIVCRFFIGCPVDKTRIVILEPPFIAREYLSTYFFFDFVPVMSFMVFYFIYVLDMKYRLFIYQMHKLRLVRIKTLLDTADLVMRRMRINESKRNITVIFIIGVIFLHEWTCILGFVTTARKMLRVPNNDSWLYIYERTRSKIKDNGGNSVPIINNPAEHYLEAGKMYFLHLSVVICHFVGCAMNLYKTKDGVEMLLLSLVLVTGLIFFICVFGKMLQLFSVANISETKYEEMNMQVMQYMIKKNFSPDLRTRIVKYYDYKFNKKFFSEEQILDTLTEHLRMEVLLYSCQNLISEVKAFKGLSKAAIGCVLSLLKQEIYNPEDLILPAGDGSGSIYFVLYGTCAIVLTSDAEMTHVEDGSYFGDSTSFEKYHTTQFLYSVVALEMSEVYRLDSKDINFCCRTYPEIVYKFEAMAAAKAKQYNTLFALVENEEEITDDILNQLRRGRILHSGLKRIDFA